MKQEGYTLAELVAVAGLLGLLTLTALPAVGRLLAAASIHSGALEFQQSLLRCRHLAIASGRNVGVRYETRAGKPHFVYYRDGNGNGILASEISRGVDRRIGAPAAWLRQDVRPGFLSGVRIPDPSDPRRSLPASTDPVRFGRSDICSFSPLGESTPGSVYLTDGRSRMAVVRVWGRTARIRTLFWKKGEPKWQR